MKVTNTVSQHNNKILLFIAFILVAMIWSTTPLAIKWSGGGVHFLFGILLRMGIGTVLALVLVFALYRKMPFDYLACRLYAAVALALFAGMLPVYWAAQYIASGLISVIFGLTPIVTGYLAWRFIHEQSFSGMKVLGALSGIAGLVIIFLKSTHIGVDYAYGIAAVVCAVILHSVSSVWVKSMKADMPALSMVAGGLLFSMPLFIAVYLVFAPPLPENIPLKALWSIIYLGVVGSVLGFVCYYFLLKHLPASSVALITLITPVMALWVGHVFNNETVSFYTYTGTVFVLTGMALHQWGDIFLKRLWGKKERYST